MSGTPEFLKSIQRVAVTLVLLAAGFVAVVVAWWVAVSLLLGLGAWLAVRRVFARSRAPEAPAVIEGEFEKVEEPPERLR